MEQKHPTLKKGDVVLAQYSGCYQTKKEVQEVFLLNTPKDFERSGQCYYAAVKVEYMGKETRMDAELEVGREVWVFGDFSDNCDWND